MSKTFNKIDNYQLVRCASCGLIRLSQIYTNPKTFLDDIDNNDALEYWGFPNFFLKYKNIFNYFFEERFERLNSEKPVVGEWLDIGSGYGFWQQFLNEKHIQNYGLEIEEKAVSYAKENNVNIELISIENFSTSKKYAVITMCDVLEHVEYPQEILKKCYELLLPGGLLYVQVPNVIGFKYPYRDSLGLPHHLWQFDPSTMLHLLKQEKFTVLNYWTGIQGVIRFYENGGPGFFRKLAWRLARLIKRGNRLQVLVKK